MSDVCLQCARRDWLLAKLSMRLNYKAHDLPRFWRILELPDRELIDALGGRWRANLHAEYVQWHPEPTQAREDIERICRHHPAYPHRLRSRALAPRTLDVCGGIERLGDMLEQAVVAIVGTRRASDYGIETARDLAHGLAASGVTVVSGLDEGIPYAVHAGALQVRGATLTVMAGGVGRCSPACCNALYGRITDCGCAISETQSSAGALRWAQTARARTLALLAQLVIVVEAEESPWELACAQVAQALDSPVAAVPGRVSSPASSGTNRLLMEGARLVRNPQDALDALYGVANQPQAMASPVETVTIEQRLRGVLEDVSRGDDTIVKLTARGHKSAETALALAELELSGLLRRGNAGRYVPAAGVRAV